MRSQNIRIRSCFAFLAVLALWALGEPSRADDSHARLEVSFRNGWLNADAENVPLSTFVRAIAAACEYQIRFQDPLNEPITLFMRVRDCADALNALSIVSQLGYFIKDSTIVVGCWNRPGEVARRFNRTERIQLKWISPDSLREKSPDVSLWMLKHIRADGNAITIEAPLFLFDRIKEFIELVDRPPVVVRFEMTLVQLRQGDSASDIYSNDCDSIVLGQSSFDVVMAQEAMIPIACKPIMHGQEYNMRPLSGNTHSHHATARLTVTPLAAPAEGPVLFRYEIEMEQDVEPELSGALSSTKNFNSRSESYLETSSSHRFAMWGDSDFCFALYITARVLTR
ncbi:MAG: hypothetical protein AAB229_03265 [Candidatus Hydrogenedentota bacterium]